MGSENPNWTVEQANEHVSDYVSESFTDAYGRLQREQAGDGCGCWNCLTGACNDLNDWTDWLAEGADNAYPHFRVDPKTRQIEEYFPSDE